VVLIGWAALATNPNSRLRAKRSQVRKPGLAPLPVHQSPHARFSHASNGTHGLDPSMTLSVSKQTCQQTGLSKQGRYVRHHLLSRHTWAVLLATQQSRKHHSFSGTLHALDLPEIKHHIAQFLNTRHCLTCPGVCRAWRHTLSLGYGAVSRSTGNPFRTPLPERSAQRCSNDTQTLYRNYCAIMWRQSLVCLKASSLKISDYSTLFHVFALSAVGPPSPS